MDELQINLLSTKQLRSCVYGITGFVTSLYISENRMTNMNTGIYARNCNNRSILVWNNDITCKNYGVRSAFNNLPLLLKIHHNTITLNATSGNYNSAAINIDESAVNIGKNKAFINHNVITVTKGLNAIALNRTANSAVFSNTITLNDATTTNVNGIFSNTCDMALIHVNTVEGSGPTGNTQRAFNTTSTTLSYLTKNYMNNTHVGMFYDDPCSDSWMICNEMHDHDFGDQVGDGMLFGHKHVLALNTWTGTYGIWGFDYLLGLFPALNEFHYNTSDADSWPPGTFTENWRPTGFFQDIPEEAEFGCNELPSNPADMNPVVSDFDYIVASQTIERPHYQWEYNYILRSNLYIKYSLYPDSIPAESSIDSFYTANSSTSIGLFNAVNRVAKSLFTIDTATMQTIYINDSLVNALMMEIAINDSILNDTIYDADSLVILEQNQINKAKLNYILESNRLLFTAIDSLNQYYSDSIISLNDDISVSETIEENQKIITNIYFSTISRGIFDFDSAQAATIFSIAIQCPDAGGKSVLIAQAIYRLINDTIVFQSDTNCIGASPRLSKTEENELHNSFVYPNPSTYSATLNFRLPEKQDGWFIIYDILSRENARYYLKTESRLFSFKCNTLNQGIYSYKIITQNKITGYGKFTIIK